MGLGVKGKKERKEKIRTGKNGGHEPFSQTPSYATGDDLVSFKWLSNGIVARYSNEPSPGPTTSNYWM
jgi:hypothetical protein